MYVPCLPEIKKKKCVKKDVAKREGLSGSRKAAHEVKGELTYDDEGHSKIIGLSLEKKFLGLLAVGGEKLFNI